MARNRGLAPLLLGVALAPLALTSAGEPCPDGFVQAEPVVFPCAGSGGKLKAKYLAAAGPVRTAFTIPKGTEDLEITMTYEEQGEVDLIIYSPAVQTYVVKSDTGIVNNKKRSVTHTLGSESMTIEYTGSEEFPEAIRMSGVTPRAWQVQVLNKGIYPVSITLTYSFTAVRGCPSTWVEGCTRFDPFRVQRTVVEWSAWAQEQYKNADRAWRELAGSMTEAFTNDDGIRVPAVPYYKWSYVWGSWPLAHDKGSAWTDAFYYIAGNKDFVTRSDFQRAFALDTVSQASKICMSQLHKNFPNSAAAFESLVVGGAQAELALLSDCSDATGVSVEALDAFMWSADGRSGVSREEFEVNWHRLNACPPQYYRASPMIFYCHSNSGRAKFFVRARETAVVTDIPKGVVNLRIGIVADQDADLLLWDPVDRVWVVKWHDGVVDRNQNDGTYKGVQIHYSGDDTHPPLVEEFVTFTGELPVELNLQVNNFATRDATVVVTYSWDGIAAENCPAVPKGCEAFVESDAESTVQRFSGWLARKYGSEDAAWQSLGQQYAAQSSSLARLSLGLAGVPFYQWQEVWNRWPASDTSTSTWQENFHMVDADENGVVDEAEFRTLFRASSVEAFTKYFFEELIKTYPNRIQAWHVVRGAGSTGPTLERWNNIMTGFLRRGELPGGKRVCQAVPQLKPYSFRHTAPMHDRPLEIAKTDELGLVGSSFTALARVWRDPKSLELTSQFIDPGTILVFNTPLTAVSDFEAGKALFMGIQGNRLTLSFGTQLCMTDRKVPLHEWRSVAWVYDAEAKEQRLYVDGKTVKVCPGIMPFNGPNELVWAGSTVGDVAVPGGALNSLYLFPTVLSDAEITNVFRYAPAWAQSEQYNLFGCQLATVMGTASDLGLHGGSFTVALDVYRDASQENEESVYSIMGGLESDSMKLAVDHGKLSLSVGGWTCVANRTVPVETWVRVAFVYNMAAQEQLIYQDGKLVRICGGVPPHQGTGGAIWMGKSAPPTPGGHARCWRGSLREITVLPRSECAANIDATFDKNLRRLIDGSAEDASAQEEASSPQPAPRRLDFLSALGGLENSISGGLNNLFPKSQTLDMPAFPRLDPPPMLPANPPNPLVLPAESTTVAAPVQPVTVPSPPVSQLSVPTLPTVVPPPAAGLAVRAPLPGLSLAPKDAPATTTRATTTTRRPKPRAPPRPVSGQVRDSFRRVDGDNDGYIERDEFYNAVALYTGVGTTSTTTTLATTTTTIATTTVEVLTLVTQTETTAPLIILPAEPASTEATTTQPPDTTLQLVESTTASDAADFFPFFGPSGSAKPQPQPSGPPPGAEGSPDLLWRGLQDVLPSAASTGNTALFEQEVSDAAASSGLRADRHAARRPNFPGNLVALGGLVCLALTAALAMGLRRQAPRSSRSRLTGPDADTEGDTEAAPSHQTTPLLVVDGAPSRGHLV